MSDLEDMLLARWRELEDKFWDRSLNFEYSEMEAFETFEDFLSSLPQGQALRLIMTGY